MSCNLTENPDDDVSGFKYTNFQSKQIIFVLTITIFLTIMIKILTNFRVAEYEKITLMTNKNNMAKFIKSIFTSDNKRKTSRLEGDGEGEKEDFSPPLDSRRKLSISRTGRMKQANKKRHELDMDLYGENIQRERPKSIEYHVNKAVDHQNHSTKRSSLDSGTEKDKEGRRSSVNERRGSVEAISPEEEIESAFEIIDKIS